LAYKTYGDFMKQLKKSKRPDVLTVNGKADVVMQDARACQRLLDMTARSDLHEAIRQGLEEVRAGKGRSLREFLAEFKATYGIPH